MAAAARADTAPAAPGLMASPSPEPADRSAPQEPPPLLRLKPGTDGATPSPNGVAAQNLLRLAGLLGYAADDNAAPGSTARGSVADKPARYARLARATCAAFAAEMLEHPFLFVGLLDAVVALELGVRVAVAVGPASSRAALIRRARQAAGPAAPATAAAVVAVVGDDDDDGGDGSAGGVRGRRTAATADERGRGRWLLQHNARLQQWLQARQSGNRQPERATGRAAGDLNLTGPATGARSRAAPGGVAAQADGDGHASAAGTLGTDLGGGPGPTRSGQGGPRSRLHARGLVLLWADGAGEPEVVG